MCPVLHFFDATLIKAKPRGYVMVSITPRQHCADDWHIGLVYKNPTSTSFSQGPLLFGWLTMACRDEYVKPRNAADYTSMRRTGATRPG